MSLRVRNYTSYPTSCVSQPASVAQARDAALNVNITNAYKHWTEFRWGTSLSFGRAFCNCFRSFHTTGEAIVVTSLGHHSTLWSWLLAVSLLTQADILIGSGVVVERNQPEAGFRHAGADAVGPGQLI